MTQPARQDEARKVERALQFLLSRFGTPAIGGVETQPGNYLDIEISAGDIPYWSAVLAEPGSKSEKITHRATYELLGDGLLTATFVQVKGAWSIRSVGFGLSAASSGARDKISAISRQMFAEIASLPEDKLDNAIGEVVNEGR
jgi:hypothetical protein